MANLNFNANDVEPTTPFEPIPNDKYRAMVIESEIKPTKNGTGHYLQLVWEVLDGDFKGRRIWDRLNISNQNKQAEEIAQRTLSAICRAVGVMQVRDSQQLHQKPAYIKVVVKQDTGYEPRNDIKGYEPVDGAASIAPAPAAAPAASAPAWARKAS